jgi:catechol 2,3-dioxygenase-like lactoylglutathione lyase family enzyme
MSQLRWGHVNINVSELDASIEFYRKLGFELFMPAIPYFGLSMGQYNVLPDDAAEVLGVPKGTSGRACIMQLGDTFPKIDLTELEIDDPGAPLANRDRGMVRLCLGSANLSEDCERLRRDGVSFVSGPGSTNDGLADVAICADPDGTLIELIQPHLEKWPSID